MNLRSRNIQTRGIPKVRRDQVSMKRKTRRKKPSTTDQKAHIKVPVRKPVRFSYVIDGFLAGHGRPSHSAHLEYLRQKGIKCIVTLTENMPKALQQYTGDWFRWVHIPVKDEKPPSVDQVHEFVTVVNKFQTLSQAVSVHCAHGRGRTGTMLACYLAVHKSLTASEAIQHIKQLRPGSIDTHEQDLAVHEYVTWYSK